MADSVPDLTSLLIVLRSLIVWRSLFLAIGIMLVILGLECLMIDSASVYASGNGQSGEYLIETGPATPGTKLVKPSEWHPWSLMGLGALTILYSVTIKRAGVSSSE